MKLLALLYVTSFFVTSLMFTPTAKADADIPKSIRLAATDWCPYTCAPQEPNQGIRQEAEKQAEPGIVVEYLRSILSPHNITLDIKYLPWKRAIQEVELGKISGLVTAVPSEAPNLLFTTTATMNYGVCLYSHDSNDWEYKNTGSLNDKVLGAALDYSYNKDLDAYIKKSNNTSKITTVTGEDKLSRFYSMLESQRIDAFVSDQYVASWNAKKYNIDLHNIKINKCFEKHNFYFALNPDIAWGKNFISLLNNLLSSKASHKVLKEIIDRYTINSSNPSIE